MRRSTAHTAWRTLHVPQGDEAEAGHGDRLAVVLVLEHPVQLLGLLLLLLGRPQVTQPAAGPASHASATLS